MLDFQFSKFQNFNSRKGQEGQHASSQGAKFRGDWSNHFSIFQDGGCRRLGFSKFRLLNGQKGQEGQRC